MVSFGLWEFTDVTPEEITILLGLHPLRVFRKGLPDEKNPRMICRENGWIFASPEPDMYDFFSFEKQLKALFQVLEEKKELLKPLCDKWSAEISCGIYLDVTHGTTKVPAIHIEKEYNALATYLNIEWDIDIIVHSSVPPTKRRLHRKKRPKGKPGI